MTTKTMTSTRRTDARGKRARGGGAAKRAAPAGKRSPHPAGRHTDRNPSRQRQMVAEAAYFKAEKRGFDPGHEMADWLEAERDLRSLPGWE